MIITRLIGGLGNQMFQYAAGLAVAKRLGVSLKLDISDFKLYPDREYALHCFDIETEFATEREIYLLSGSPQTSLQRIVHRIKKINNKGGKAIGVFLRDPSNNPTLFVDTKCGYNVNIERITDGCYLRGYWQSELYFIKIADTIRRIFTVKYPLAGKNLEVANRIKESPSVCIHVRRGDYVSDPMARKVHGLSTIDYYHAAVEQLLRKFSNLEFFVFSDDPIWVRKNLAFGSTMFVIDHNSPKVPWEDLRLMTLCRHHIIANSSFSWWAAWLGNSKDQIVVAPKKWYLSERRSNQDLIPARWNTLNVELKA